MPIDDLSIYTQVTSFSFRGDTCIARPLAKELRVYPMEAYKQATAIFSRLYRLEHAGSILSWDNSVNMPPKGGEARGACLAELSVIGHELITSPKLKELIEELQTESAQAALSDVERANVREIHNAWVAENKLPADLVSKISLASNNSQGVWRKARGLNDWDAFLPCLEEIVDLSRQKARLLASGTDLSPYEALMALYEPGARVAPIKALFEDLKQWLPELVKKATADPTKAASIIAPKGPFAIDKQKALGVECMKTWNFDFDMGRLDVSAHPFCGGVPEDVRLTTRYTEDGFDESLLGIIHETGHGKYEQNRPRHLLDQPVSKARSMGIHESQSLFAEMQIGRSDAFSTYIVPKLIATFGEQPAFTVENMTKHAQRVEKGLIRVDADELTYPLHVILRFEIELGLIEGTIEAKDVPAEWSRLMKQYLDIDMELLSKEKNPEGGPSTNNYYKDGCMQDIHWSMMALGYFPTYTLGAMYAAQFMAACRKDLGGDAVVDAMIREGKLDKILEWQREKIWQHGSIFETDELCSKASGSKLDASYFRRHLEARYGQ